MKAGKTILLFALVLGLAGYIFLHERHQLSQSERERLMTQAFRVHPDQVTRLQIRTADYEVDVYQTNSVWRLSLPAGARASEPVVRQTLSRLRNLNRGELITPEDMRKRGQTLGDFGLLLPKVALTIETPLQTREYRVGDPTPLGQSLYVKEEDSQNVMLVSMDLLDILPPQADLFFDAVVFPFKQENVSSFSLVQSEQSLRVVRQQDSWQLTEPRSYPADSAKVNALLEKMMRVRAEGYVNEPEVGRDYGIVDGRDQIRIQPSGSAVPYELSLGGDVDENPGLIYARIEGRAGLIMVSKGLRVLARSPATVMRNTQILTAEAAAGIRRIRLTSGEEFEMTFQKVENQWMMIRPLEKKADSEKIDTLIKAWTSGMVVAFGVPVAEEISRTEVRFTDADEREIASFGLLQTDVAPGRSILRLTNEEWVRATPDLSNFTPLNPEYFLSKEVFEFATEDVVRVQLTRTSDDQTEASEFAKDPDADRWVLRNSDRTPNEQAVKDFLTVLSGLEALEIASLASSDLSAYGLEKPVVQLSLGLGGLNPTNKTLLVSDRSDDGTAYALIMGDSVIYVLSPLHADLLWTPLTIAETVEPELNDAQPEKKEP